MEKDDETTVVSGPAQDTLQTKIEPKREEMPETLVEGTTPEDRKQQQEGKEPGRITRLEKTVGKLEKLIDNMDTGAGAGIQGLLVTAGIYLQKGEYFVGITLIACAVFGSVMKNRMEQGSIAKWIRMPKKQMVETAKDKAKDMVQTFIG